MPRSREKALKLLPGVFSGQTPVSRTTVSAVSPDCIRILASSDPHITAGSSVLPSGIVATAAREGRTIQKEDPLGQAAHEFGQDSRFQAGLALPIRERDTVTAVLYVERERAFTAEERHALKLFVKSVGDRLTANSRTREASIMAALSLRLSGIANLKQAATVALRVIAPATGANAGLVMSDQRGVMLPIATHNARRFSAAHTELKSGQPYPQGLTWQACLSGEVKFARNYQNDPASIERLHQHLAQAIVVAPIGQHATRHAVLGLQYENDAHVSEADLALLRNVCQHLAVILSSVHAYALQDHLLLLHARSGKRSTNDLYRQILEAAITHVPGAETGTLLVRSDPNGPFTYEAAIGFDLGALREATFNEQQIRSWYGRSTKDWNAGHARILTSREVNLDKFSRAGGRNQPADHGNLTNQPQKHALPARQLPRTSTRDHQYGQLHA